MSTFRLKGVHLYLFASIIFIFICNIKILNAAEVFTKTDEVITPVITENTAIASITNTAILTEPAVTAVESTETITATTLIATSTITETTTTETIENTATITATSIQSFPAYVINLPKDTERMDKLRPQLESLGIEYTLFEATNGTELRRFGVLQKMNLLYPNELEHQQTLLDSEIKYDIKEMEHRTGEAGCWLSHLRLLLKISRSNSTGPILILEDDAQFTSSFLSKSLEIINKLPSNWDSLRVGFCPYYSYSTCRTPDGLFQPNTDFCKVNEIIAGAQAYFVNGPRAARKIFDQLNSVKDIIVDLEMRPSINIEQYSSHIKLVNQDHSFVSNLQNPRC